MYKYDLITILGPTASGKTAFATSLAAQLGSEIISADSRQLYRGMDLGTGKDLSDYIVDGKQITLVSKYVIALVLFYHASKLTNFTAQ